MSGTTEVRGALLAWAFDVAGANLPKATTALENAKFSPPAGRYYRLTFLPGEPIPAAIGSAAQNHYVGIFQIDVFDPINQGDASTIIEAERIAKKLTRGSALVYLGVTTNIEKSWRLPAIQETDRYHVPIRVQWWADIDN